MYRKNNVLIHTRYSQLLSLKWAYCISVFILHPNCCCFSVTTLTLCVQNINICNFFVLTQSAWHQIMTTIYCVYNLGSVFYHANTFKISSKTTVSNCFRKLLCLIWELNWIFLTKVLHFRRNKASDYKQYWFDDSKKTKG